MRVLTSPFISGDAIFFWTPKAKIFFAHQLAPSLSFGDLGEFFHADYPLFVPLTEAWTFICVGRADEYLMKLLFPLYAILLVVGVWVVTARFAGRCAGWIAAALLATTPVLLWQGTAAMADLPLALYGWLATAMLLRWCVEGERRFLVLCALFAGMTGWIKNEGLALIVVTGCLVALHLATQRRSAIGRRMGDMLLFAAVAAAVILPWLVVRACCGLEADLHMPRAGSFWSLVEARWRSIGSALAGRLFSPAGVSGTWNLAWYLLMGVILVHASALLRSPLRYPALLIVGQVAVYTGVYFITPHDVDWQLATSLDRLFLHVYPQALLLVGWGMRGIVEGRPESATADVRGAG
jgi:4-amino-4-deoxy-L-arabinose transferase-like glycosyltransferase